MQSQFIHIFATAFYLIPAFLISLSVHESSHALMAYVLGDNTAKKRGRISLNPFVHIDPWGLLSLIVFRIGWARPVTFDPRNFKRPKLYSVLTAFAGPASNILLAVFVLLILRFLPLAMMPIGIAITLQKLLTFTAQISVMLGVFNLMPIPPLDGSHLLTVLLADRFPQFVFWLYRYSFLILIVLIFFVPGTREGLLFLINAVYKFLYTLVMG